MNRGRVLSDFTIEPGENEIPFIGQTSRPSFHLLKSRLLGQFVFSSQIFRRGKGFLAGTTPLSSSSEFSRDDLYTLADRTHATKLIYACLREGHRCL